MKLPFPKSFTEKHRPQTIEGFIGLHKPRKVLESFVKHPFDSAWLFLGPSGVGKTTMALAIAEQLQAELHHIPSRSCDLETVEATCRMCWNAAFNFKTGKAAPFHLILVDEADQMTSGAQNSFLSKLDGTDQPPRTIFIFTANNTASLEGRFQSRCRPLDFSNESLEGELEDYLQRIYRKEGGKYPLNLVEICKLASYNVRDALMKLEVEVMMGADRSDLPPEKELEIVEEHTHNCKKCRKTWSHRDAKCGLPYVSVCAACGGVTSVGRMRALKAWDTIRSKVRAEVESEKKQKTRKKRRT